MSYVSRRQRLWILSLNLAASLLLSFTLALAVSAQTTDPGTGTLPPDFGLEQTARKAGLPVPSTNPNPIAVASTVINTLLGLVGVIAVIVIIYGGFTWLTSAGNEEKVTKAKKLLASAVIGVAIILGAYTITSFVVKSIGEAAKTGSAGYSGDRCTNHPGGTCLDACTGALVPFTQLDCADGKICCANAP